MNCLVQLDFSAFKPTTLLSKWWQIVAQHFRLLQDAHNALDECLTDEIAAREADKEELLRLQGEETAQRQQADNNLAEGINAAKTEMSAAISSEADTRVAADTRIDGEISVLKAASHTHENFEVLGDITAEDVYKWNKSADEKLENTEFLDYLDGVCADMSRKIGELYTLGGVEVYDGGLYGEIYAGASLDGGDDKDTERTVVDFGSFDDIMPGEATIDGGVYA